MSDRERLVKRVTAAYDKWVLDDNDDREQAEVAVDAILSAGVTLPHAPPPVLEVTELADKAYKNAYMARKDRWDEGVIDGLRSAFPHLLRSCADGLTDEECEAIAADIGMMDNPGLIRTILRRVAARREA